MSYPIDANEHAVRLVPTAAGALAVRRLSHESDGRIVAKFEQSMYVRLGDATFVCIGRQIIGSGPLNVLLDDCDWHRLRVLPLGETLVAGDAFLLFPSGLRIELGQAPLWRPRHSTPSRAMIVQRLRRLDALAPRLLPGSGLARLAFPQASSESDPMLRFARPAWGALERWLNGCISERTVPAPESTIARLIGLGPGLTPSGDDVIGGVLIALLSLRQTEAADVLWSWLEPQLGASTSEISAAHVRAAAQGHGHAALHALLDCDDPSSLESALHRLQRVGHSSGWDALAGVAMVWCAYALAPTTSRTASSAACAFDGATTTPASPRVRRCAE